MRHRPSGLLIGTALLIAACSPSGPPPASVSQPSPSPESTSSPRSQTPESSPASSPTESPGASVVAGPHPTIAWSEHAFGEFAGAVIADADRFVVVSGEHGKWAAWTSTDGTSWESHAVPGPSTAHCDAQEPICIERSAAMGPLVRLHDTLYSFGATQFFNDGVRAVGWRWTDGQEWQVIDSENPIFSGGAFRAATASDSAIFAVTHAGYPFTERHWRWTADTSWEPVGEPISTENPIEFRSVAWADGMYLAVGAVWEVDEDIPAWEWERSSAVWSSPDGTTWTSLALPDDSASLCSVTTLDGTFIALGVNDGHPTTWRSPDGVRWSAGTLPTSVPDAGCGGNVVRLSGGFLAFVSTDDLTLTWTSADGSTWEEGPTLDIRTGPFSIAAIDDRVVAFGRRGPLEPLDGDQTQVLLVGTVNSIP